MLGVAGPIALGVATGHVPIGIAASVGGLALSDAPPGDTPRQRRRALAFAVAAGSTAFALGTAIGRLGAAGAFAVPVIAAVAGMLGGINRPIGHAAALLVLFCIIATGLAAPHADPLANGILFGIGALWTAGAAALLDQAFRAPAAGQAAPPAPAPRPDHSAQVLLRRWRGSLRHWAAWQYAVRIGVCLTAAEALAVLWPRHHTYWVALTVAIVVRRQIPNSLMRTFQRGAGTTCGVLLATLLVFWQPGEWGLIAAIAVLAASRPLLRAGNYAAYAAVMTPLVMLLLDFGQPQSLGTMRDRLAGTVAGCLIALTLGNPSWLAGTRRT